MTISEGMEAIENKHKWTFLDDGHILYHDHGSGYIYVYVSMLIKLYI